MVSEPRATLRTIIVSAGHADHAGELRFPVHALGAIGNAKAIGDAEAAMRMDLFPCELVRADVEPAPALRIGDESRHRHWPFDHHWQAIADRNVAPISRSCPAHFLV